MSLLTKLKSIRAELAAHPPEPPQPTHTNADLAGDRRVLDSRLAEITNLTDADRRGTVVEICEADMRGESPQMCRVTLVATGEVLLDRTSDPEHDACRVLDERGITGSMAITHPGKPIICARMQSIEAGAQRATREDKHRGPMITRYKPFRSSSIGDT